MVIIPVLVKDTKYVSRNWWSYPANKGIPSRLSAASCDKQPECWSSRDEVDVKFLIGASAGKTMSINLSVEKVTDEETGQTISPDLTGFQARGLPKESSTNSNCDAG